MTTLIVKTALNYIKGNSAPYFSVTAYEYEGQRLVACGCLHDEIERQYPGKFSDLIALHLSDIDGAPTHAEANGWYWLAGALGGLGEQYHGGNSSTKKTAEECMKIFADHVRVPMSEAREIGAQVLTAMEEAYDGGVFDAGYRARRNAAGKARLSDLIAAMRPRWKAEAEACIKAHKLIVTGDTWKAA